jgi:hypothetical protein
VLNHRVAFRPLRGGVQVMQSQTLEAGTLGLVVTKNGTDRWALTCRHVLARPAGTVVNGDAVLQPDASVPPVGLTDVAASDPGLDCAAVQLLAGTDGVADILGIGRPTARTQAVVGMRVIKSGWKTGITEGRVQSVIGNQVRIERLPSYPAEYRLAESGDSGAVWVEAATLAPVALHRAEASVGVHLAFASDLAAVFAVLGVRQL